MKQCLTAICLAAALAATWAVAVSGTPARAQVPAPQTLDPDRNAPLLRPSAQPAPAQADQYRAYCQTASCTGSYEHDRLPMENRALEQQLQQQRNDDARRGQ